MASLPIHNDSKMIDEVLGPTQGYAVKQTAGRATRRVFSFLAAPVSGSEEMQWQYLTYHRHEKRRFPISLGAAKTTM